MKRNTIQRAMTLAAVRSLQNHPTAEQIYAEVAAEYPNISKGTIYRNLNQLLADGEIGAVEVPGAADHFDHCTKKHYHVYCTSCGQVFDVDMDYMPELEQAITDAHGFRFLGHDLLFKGICPGCGASENGEA